MLWVRSKAVEFYLSETLLGCKGLDGADERWAQAAGLDAAVAQLRVWITESAAPVRARVWLGSSLARPLIVGGDSGAKDPGEAKALASMRASEITGLSGDLKVWTGPWRSNRPTLAVAMPQAVLSLLTQMTDSPAGKRWRIDSVRPWWNQVFDAVLDRSHAQSRTIAWTLAEPDGLVHGRVERGEATEGAYEAIKARDPDWALLRRRLTVSWGGVDEVEHFGFEQGGATASRNSVFAIARATLLVDERGAA